MRRTFIPVECLAEAAAELPMAVGIFTRLSAQLANINTTLEDVITTVELDGVLAARVIRLANSPLYRRGEPILSLNDAIAFIGTQQTCDLIGGLVSSRLFANDLPHYGLTSDVLWNASITSTIAARHLAYLAGCNEGECYTLALLRGIGRLLLQVVALQQGIAAPVPAHRNLHDTTKWEKHVFGMDSAEATIQLMQLWNLSPVGIGILRQLRVRKYTTRAVAVLYLANWITTRTGDVLDIESTSWTLESEALKSCALEPHEIEDVIKQTVAEVAKMRLLLAFANDTHAGTPLRSA